MAVADLLFMTSRRVAFAMAEYTDGAEVQARGERKVRTKVKVNITY